MFDFHTHLLGWWLIIPASMLVLIFLCVFKWRCVRVFTGLSIVTAIGIAVLYAVSSNTNYATMTGWQTWGSTGNAHTWGLDLQSQYGGIQLSLIGSSSPDIH